EPCSREAAMFGELAHHEAPAAAGELVEERLLSATEALLFFVLEHRLAGCRRPQRMGPVFVFVSETPSGHYARVRMGVPRDRGPRAMARTRILDRRDQRGFSGAAVAVNHGDRSHHSPGIDEGKLDEVEGADLAQAKTFEQHGIQAGSRRGSRRGAD